MRIFLSYFILLASVLFCSVFAQTCYFQLQDASGVNVQSHFNELNEAACNLRDAFPTEFQNDFGVYDFGFYLEIEKYGPDYDHDLILQEVISSIDKPYYLLIAKESSSTGIYEKYHVDIKIPDTGPMECVQTFPSSVVEALKTKVRMKLNDSNSTSPADYWSAEIGAMEILENEILDLVTCCDTTVSRNSAGCNPCLFSPYEFGSHLIEKGFISFDCEILDDPDFNSTTSKPARPTKSATGIAGSIDALVFALNEEIDLDEAANQIVQEYENQFDTVNLNASVYLVKFERDCILFEDLWNQFVNETSDGSIFYMFDKL